MWSYLLTNGRRRRTLLLLGDALLLGGIGVLLVHYPSGCPSGRWPILKTEGWLLLGLAGSGLLYAAHRTRETMKRPEILTLLASGVLWGFFWLGLPFLPLASPPPVWVLVLLTAAVACAWHGMAEKVLSRPARLVLVGRDPFLAEIRRLLASEPTSFEVAWISDLSPLQPGEGTAAPPRRVDAVVYGRDPGPACDSLVQLRLKGLAVWDAATFYQHLTARVPVTAITPSWLLDQLRHRRGAGRVYAVVKRLLDLALALLLLPVALPVLAVCALAIKLDSKGPVFFVQERLGEGGVPFRLYKLRTMVVEAEAGGPQWCRDQDPRITRVGRVLRRLRLDELPQIFNVLKNDMSFVGPRPIRAHFTELLAHEIPFYRLRLAAKPGLSGWAQVHSGHANTVAAHALMLQYDLFYLLNRSLLLDLLVLIKTIRVLLTGQGR